MTNLTFRTDTSKKIDNISNVFDREWAKSTFIIGDKDIVDGDDYKKWIRANRYFTSASFKFTSTSPGMNVAVNPKPQFTRFCDIRNPGKINSRRKDNYSIEPSISQYGLGMGDYYSEAYDDNEQRIFLRFGVPTYQPLTAWLAKSFDIDKVILQNRGVITSTLIKAIGVVAMFFAISRASLLAFGIFSFRVITQDNRFYTFKSTMYIYWATVENILNQMVARRTMLPYVLSDYAYKLDNFMNKEQRITDQFISNIHEFIPNLIDKETGRISVFALALRAQSAFNNVYKADYEKNKDLPLASDFTGYQDTGNTSHDTYFTNRKSEPSLFTKYLFDTAYELLCKDRKDINSEVLTTNPDNTNTVNTKSLIEMDFDKIDENGVPIEINLDPNDPLDTVESRIQQNINKKKEVINNYGDYLLAELSEGAAFAVFNVEHTGSVGESFSNSTTNNPIETTFNSLSSKARNMLDILSSASSIPIIGDTMKFLADTSAKVVSEITFGLANPLLALAYGVNITMPKIWESSAATLPRASYKIKLISPYGNAYSQLFNIYLPLAMILAGSLPRSTGSSTYTSPFICQLFDRGRVNINLGIIDNVSITRGTSNLAFTKSGHPNAIDVDISIANLDEILALDITSNGIITRALDQLDPKFDDTPFVSYINTITGVDVYHQIYKIPMLRLKLAERYMTLKALPSDSAALAAFTVNTVPGLGFIRDIVLGNNQAALQDLFYK